MNPNTNILKQAMITYQKEFIAHEYAQEYLNEQWFGLLEAKSSGGRTSWTAPPSSTSTIGTVIYIILSPLVLLYLGSHFLVSGTVLRYSPLGDALQFLNTPRVKFVAATLMYVTFGAVLVAAASIETTVYWSAPDYIISVWVFALLVAEVREGITRGSVAACTSLREPFVCLSIIITVFVCTLSPSSCLFPSVYILPPSPHWLPCSPDGRLWHLRNSVDAIYSASTCTNTDLFMFRFSRQVERTRRATRCLLWHFLWSSWGDAR